MKYCKSCNLKYDSTQTNCVFCNNPLEELDNTPTKADYPPFKGFYPWKDIVKRSITFGLLVLIAASIILHIYLFKDLPIQHLVFGSSIYIYLVMNTILSTRRQVTAKILFITLFTAAETLFVILILNLEIKMLFYEYILPALLIGCLITQIFFLYVFKAKAIHDNMLYCILGILLGVIPAICTTFEVIDHTWLIAISCALSILFFLWLIIFERHHLIEELKRRLHI